MRVAFIVTSFPDLSGTFILDKITGLIERGHEVDIFADRPGDLKKMHPDVNRFRLLDRTYYSPMPHNVILRYAKGLVLFFVHVWKNPAVMLRSLNVFSYGLLSASLVLLYGALPLLRRKSYDIIHCQFGPNGLKGVFFRENGLLEGKLITHFYGYDVNVYPRRWGTDVYKRLFRSGDLFTANSRFLMDRALSLGCPKDRLIKLPTGINLSRFRYAARTLEPGREVRILTIARLVEVKGVEYSIRAVAKVASRVRDIRYQIVGGGPLTGQLKKLARELGVAYLVDFLDWQTRDKVLEMYADAHIFVLSGVVGKDGAEEGQPTVVIEAQATGLPVISSRLGGTAECLVDGKSGFLVPQRDVNALADKLFYLIEHPERWAEMGQVGREYIENNLDLQKLNDRLVGIYQDLLSGTW